MIPVPIFRDYRYGTSYIDWLPKGSPQYKHRPLNLQGKRHPAILHRRCLDNTVPGATLFTYYWSVPCSGDVVMPMEAAPKSRKEDFMSAIQWEKELQKSLGRGQAEHKAILLDFFNPG